MINEMKALSMAEASKYVEKDSEAFIKKFTKLKHNEAEKLREELEKLNNLKMKSEHIAKIIDLLPEDEQDIAKIFVDISLEQNESTQILEIVKKYK